MSSEWMIFAGFCAIALAVLAGMGYFLRATLSSVASVASIHAKIYALAYVKGGALMLIAAGAAFDTGFAALSQTVQQSMPWAIYVIFFWKPIAAALSVLVAFLDRSSQRADEGSSKATAPFATTTPPLTPPPSST